MKAASEVSFKMLLPIKVEANIVHPPPPGVVDVGQCMLFLQKDMTPVEPDFFGTFDRAISRDEWASRSKATSAIDVEGISFQRFAPPRSRIQHRIVLYSPDRSARFQVFGWATTPYARTDHGTIVYVRGRGSPPLDGGWAIPGRSFAEVWADAGKRALYNSVFPPTPQGEPQPVGVFQ
jgi:hypothetical protein